MAPFRNRNCNIYFYDLQLNLQVNRDSIVDIINKNNINIFFWINYFGFFQEGIDYIKKNTNNVIFIEDNTHSFLSREKKFKPDISFASLRKLLPITDGAFIETDLFENSFKSKNQNYSDIFSIASYFKNSFLFKDYNVSRRKYDTKKEIKNEEHKYYSISRISKFLLNRLEFENVINIRRNNFLKWSLFLKEHNVFQLFPVLKKTTCPYGVIVLIPQRDLVINELKKKNIYLKVDWEILNFMNKYTNSFFIARNSISLPVNENINEKKIKRIIFEISKIIGRNWKFDKLPDNF